jgi:hypothetical protein
MSDVDRALALALKTLRTTTPDLNKPVEVLRAAFTPDGMGGRTQTTAVVGVYLGKRRSIGDSLDERTVAQQVAPQLVHIITLPWNAVVQETDQLRIEGETFVVSKKLTATDQATLRLACIGV